ncbi:MAG: carbohydrate ABC transporter permease [Candidatus Symbiobacter sp.]|nr:carbohydrate ABC transporter permease [Candidatus Symbiobacter sp.]
MTNHAKKSPKPSKIAPVARRSLGFRILAYGCVGIWSASSVFFVLWVILASFKQNRELFGDPWSLPSQWQTANYVKAWLSSHLDSYFVNSLVVVSVSVLALLAVATPAAYVLARGNFRGREAIANFIAFGLGVPIPLLFVPIVYITTMLRLGDSLTGLTIIYVALSIPFTVYVLQGFFASIPSEFEQAARVDGCSQFQTFRLVVLPMAMPGVITAGILNFVGLWNEYQLSLVMINSSENRTLSLGIYALITSMQYSGGDWVGLFAGVTIVMLPTLLLFVILSEKMIGGMTMGGIK